MSGLIFDLPDVLVLDLLKEWVDIRDVGKLDAALCQKSARDNYLGFVKREDCIIESLPDNVQKNGPTACLFIAWVMKRKIAMTELLVTNLFKDDADDRAAYLTSQGKSIKKVTVPKVFGTPRETWDGVFKDLCMYCPNVTALDCKAMIPVSNLAHMAEGWPNLRHLIIECEQETILNPDAIMQDDNLPKTRSWFNAPHRIPVSRLPEWTRFLSTCSPHLESLSSFENFSADVYRIIAARFPRMKELVLNAENVTDASLSELRAGCPLLQSFPMVGSTAVTDAGLLALVRGGRMVSLTLQGCFSLTSEGVAAAVALCPGLAAVDLCWSEQLADPVLVALGRHCPQLRSLRATRTGVRDAGLEALVPGCPLLEEVDIDECQVWGFGLHALARHCPRLRELVAPRPSVTPSEVLLELARHCPLLETLVVSGEDIGDAEVTALAQGCPLLNWLDIAHTAVTAAGLRAVAQHSLRLRHISFDSAVLPLAEAQEIFPEGVAIRVVPTDDALPVVP